MQSCPGAAGKDHIKASSDQAFCEVKMNHPDIERAVLHHLYEAHFRSLESTSIYSLQTQGGWDRILFDKVLDRMTHDRLIRLHAAGGIYKITSQGILYAENNGIAPEAMHKENEHLRTQMLVILANAYDTGNSYSGVSIDQLAQQLGTDIYVVLYNLRLLDDGEYTEPFAQGFSRITHHGLDAVKDYRQRSELIEEFERIEKLKPHPRGRALQKLLARVFEQQGWSQEEGVRTSHEEMDIIVFREREYFLIECKWEKSPIQSGVVRELIGKLSNRIDVKGIVASMSGFARGAATQVEDHLTTRIILLFGPEDIRALIHEEATFDKLLSEKYHELVIRKRVIFR